MRWLDVLIFALTLPLCTAQSPALRVGRGSSVLTPDKGVPLAGYYSTRFAAGVHDDLHAKAVVLEAGGSRVALVACDLIAMPAAVVEQARALAASQTRIPEANIMISATHSHTGPLLMGGTARDAAFGGTLPSAQQYFRSLPARIAEAIVQAEKDLQPARMLSGKGREETISFNRRFHMKDGTVGWNPGKRNPNIVKPAGPIDPEVSVLYFESLSGEPLATYVNFALHLDTVGGQEISADYPATLSTLLGRVKSPKMLTVFSNGACGNINHVDVSTARPQKGHEEAARIGTILAGEVIKTYARLESVPVLPPVVRSKTLQLALAPVRPEDPKRAEEISRTLESGGKASFLDTVFAYRVLDVLDRKSKPYDAEVQVMIFGPELAVVALPGEIFTELGQQIKRDSPFAHTVVVELAHGPTTYFPNEAAFPQGNYEVVTSRVAPGSGERLVETARELLREGYVNLHPKP
jgi:hypothetical protein